jgi:hypothetical protein
MKEEFIKWQNDACLLDKDERADPFEVIVEYCDRAYLYNQRKDLIEMFRVALENEHWLYTEFLNHVKLFVSGMIY